MTHNAFQPRYDQHGHVTRAAEQELYRKHADDVAKGRRIGVFLHYLIVKPLYLLALAIMGAFLIAAWFVFNIRFILLLAIGAGVTFLVGMFFYLLLGQ